MVQFMCFVCAESRSLEAVFSEENSVTTAAVMFIYKKKSYITFLLKIIDLSILYN